MKRVPFVCGNWKMHHGIEATKKQVTELAAGISALNGKVDIAVAPVATVLGIAVETAQGKLPIAAQNVHFADKGAFTGEWTVAHLKELGVKYVIIGHSERRAMFNETDEAIAQKVRSTLNAGLLPIACVGETLAERESNQTSAIVTKQTMAILSAVKAEEASQLTIAYEPVWAIGTGKVATPAQAQEVHALIRSLIQKQLGAEAANVVRIQYGGSVKPENAGELMAQPDVDGALVGGASLEAASLLAIAKACVG